MSRKHLTVPCEDSGAQEKHRTAPEAPINGLLRLPFEVRLQIYRYCIPQWRPVAVNVKFGFADRQNFVRIRDETNLVYDSNLEGDMLTHMS